MEREREKVRSEDSRKERGTAVEGRRDSKRAGECGREQESGRVGEKTGDIGRAREGSREWER